MSQLSSLSPRRPGNLSSCGTAPTLCPTSLVGHPTPLTLTVQNVVPGEHDSTAHNVTFVTARPKGIPHTTAVEDLPIVFQREGREHTVKEGLTLQPQEQPRLAGAISLPPSLAQRKGGDR